MRTTLLVLLTLALTAVLVACESDGTDGTTIEGARGPGDIVQHLVEPPAFPDPVSAAPELAELHNAEGNNRHQLFLAELSDSGTLDGELVRGALVRVSEGATLTVPGGASTASLEGTAVSEVSDCPAPCEVEGPALVAPPTWLPGIGVAAGWEIVIPAPES